MSVHDVGISTYRFSDQKTSLASPPLDVDSDNSATDLRSQWCQLTGIRKSIDGGQAAPATSTLCKAQVNSDMKHLKLPLVGVLALVAVGAVTASASAHEFLAFTCKEGTKGEYSSLSACLQGTPSTGVWERVAKTKTTVNAKNVNDQGFQVANAVSVCTTATFKTEGEVTVPSETLLIHPEYTKCEVNLAGTHLATVTTTGCNYVFHAAAPNTTEGSVDLECEAGDEIKVHVSGLNCEIKVPAQSGLKTVEYVNEGGAVKVNANVTGIRWTSNCTQLEKSSGSEGEYREGAIVEETPEMGAGPAMALTEPVEDEGQDVV